MSEPNQFDPKQYAKDIHDRVHADIHERIQERVRNRVRPRHNSLFPGLILVIIGTLILLDHMGVFPVEHLWRYWPVLLIIAGAVRFVEDCNRFFSVLLLSLGTLLLLGNLGYLHLTWGELWPLVLIAVGLGMIWGRMSIPRIPPSTSSGANADPNYVTATAFFGGVERRVMVNNLTGGTISATFGGVELDFRSADMEGEQVILYVEAMFGGVELVIPERWMAIYEGQSIFGGYNDETRPPLPEVPGAPPRKRLILRGQAMFGGITVKN